MDRRNFFRALFRQTLGLLALRLTGSLSTAPQVDEPTPSDNILYLFTNPDSAIYLGQKYLERHGGLSDAGRNAISIGLGLTGGNTLSLNFAQSRIREDFLHGDTILLNGWILARTEVLLCALAATGKCE